MSTLTFRQKHFFASKLFQRKQKLRLKFLSCLVKFVSKVKVTDDHRSLEHQQEDFSTWGIVGGLLGSLLLLALVLTAVCTRRRKNIQLR